MGGIVYMLVLRSFSTRTRLFFLTGILCLFVGIVALMGHRSIEKAGIAMNDIYYDKLLPVYWLNDLRFQTQAIVSDIQTLILGDDDSYEETLLADIERRRKTSDEKMKKYGRTGLDSFEQEHLTKAEEYLASVRKALAVAISLAMSGKKNEAYSSLRSDGVELINLYIEELNALSGYCLRVAEDTNRANEEMVRRAGLFSLTVFAVVILIGVVMGALITRSITVPLMKLLGYVDRFSRGDLSVSFAHDGWDEVGQVAQGLAKMSAALKSAIGNMLDSSGIIGRDSQELAALTEEANAGVEEVVGSFKKIHSSVSDLAALGEEVNASVEEVSSGASVAAART